jgi:hypothetical protein
MLMEVNLQILVLVISSALSLAIVEIIYVAKWIISPIYLDDATVELTFVAW